MIVRSKARKAVGHLHATVKTRSSKASSTGDKGKATVVAVEDDDDDDFTDTAPWKRKGKDAQKAVQKVRPPIIKNPVGSKKLPSKVTKESSIQVPVLVSQEFPHLSEARELKRLILSKEFLGAHGK